MGTKFVFAIQLKVDMGLYVVHCDETLTGML